MESTTNALDIPWIPVTGPSGIENLTPHDVLVRSRELTDLGPTDSPSELDALSRFLIPMAALVLREGGGDGEVDDEEAVRTVLDRYRDRFELFDQERPFAQEWHVTPEERATVSKPFEMAQLHVHAPGASSASWCLRTDTRDAADSKVLPLLLLTAWYERANSNATAPGFYDGKRVSGMTPAAGADGLFYRTSFYLLGDNIADTLALNVPLSWVESDDLPVWLDQDAHPSPGQIAGGHVPLWRYTWTPNRALVLTDEGVPIGWVSGLTRRGVPEMGEGKNNAKAVVGVDHHALMRTSVDKTGKETTRRVRLDGDLHSSQGLEHWYREQLGERIAELDEERFLEHQFATRMGAHVDVRDKSNDAKSAAWVEARLRMLTIPASDSRDALMEIVRACTASNLKWSLGAAIGVDPTRDRSMLGVARSGVYAAMDQSILPALGDLADGRTVDVWGVAQKSMRAAIRAFESVTAPLVTPATIPNVSAARRSYADSIRYELRTLDPRINTKEEA